ncbi:ADP-ribosylglycohydrolase family protein [Myxococcota bacterium]|nr:ADP-ribosylglycohydrolase family protein [Myxococcota bacterium]
MPTSPLQTAHPTAQDASALVFRPPQATEAQILGCLWGLALGDAVGLPREGIPSRRAFRLFGTAPIEHAFVGRYGMISDDTEHHCMTAQAWLAAQGDPQRFGRSLAWRLRGWLLGLPAGVGFATLRAILKLWLGFPPHQSGVFSAGNGPAMRAPILGLVCHDLDQLRLFVKISTRLTHTDPQAEAGAFLIACAARLHAGLLSPSAPSHTPCELLDQLMLYAEGDALHDALLTVRKYLSQDAEASEAANALGLQRGVTGYINHTVPIAIFCWLRYLGDLRAAVEAAIRLGGDTDTVAAIVGGIVGANTPPEQMPSAWRLGLRDLPRSLAWMKRLAHALAHALPPIKLAWPLLPLRNAFFFCVVLLHGLRRLFPPY